jgi:hypothetical protein
MRDVLGKIGNIMPILFAANSRISSIYFQCACVEVLFLVDGVLGRFNKR